MQRVIFEGGRSDNERAELDLDQPPAHLERAGERYAQVHDYYDQPMQDITGRWRYRLVVPFIPMRGGHRAIDVKP